jgi:hypothetical protein
VLYLAGVYIQNVKGSADMFNILGVYSLFGYLLQIAVLQVLVRIPQLRNLPKGGAALGFLTTFALTLSAVYLLDYLKKRSRLVSGLYRIFFN